MTNNLKRVLIRFYDEKNLGDDLFIKIISERYKNNFTYVTRNPGEPFTHMPNVQAVSRTRVYMLFWKVADRLLGLRHTWLNTVAKSNDVYVYVGGSIFMESGSSAAWRREEVFYRRLSIPYFILGSNIGPYTSNDFLATIGRIFSGAEDVCLRDESSYSLVRDISSVRVSTDIAFTLNTDSYVTETDRKMVVISVVDGSERFAPHITELYEQAVADLTAKLIDDDYLVTFMSFCRIQGDEAAVDRICARLSAEARRKVITSHYRGDLELALRTIATSELVIASRFHASILALVFGKKVLPMSYSDKTLDVLKDLDFKGPVIDINKIEEFDIGTFNFSNIESNNINSQKILAEKQFQELDKVLEKRL